MATSSNPILKENPELFQELVQERRAKYTSFKARMNAKRSLSDKVADALTEAFGTVTFLALNALWFLFWIPTNMGLIPGITPFDPFPFGLLTMVVSLEAIFLAIIVLVSQNRSARVAELREEIDLHVNVQAEEEITKILVLLDRLDKKIGIPEENDTQLITMEERLNLEEIETELQREI